MRTARLCGFMLTAFCACILFTGCSNVANRQMTEVKKLVDVDIGTIEKVSVFTKDGQEIPLDLHSFTHDLSEQGKELQLSNDPLKREDLSYTVILSRKVEAPLVIQVGAKASQIANKTYRGSGAERFYKWIRKITAKSLFQAEIQAVDVYADDMRQSISLSESDAKFVWQSFRSSEYIDSLGVKQYPLYPHYRIKLDTGEKVLEANILTPTLVSIQMGSDKHYFHVNSNLFSRLTEWLPLHQSAEYSLDSFFKVTQLRIIPVAEKKVAKEEWKTDVSTEKQAVSHEVVRLLKSAVPVDGAVSLPKPARFELVFLVNGVSKTIRIYEQYLVINGQIYTHQNIDLQILDLFHSVQK